jgi:hypothetical protein
MSPLLERLLDDPVTSHVSHLRLGGASAHFVCPFRQSALASPGQPEQPWPAWAVGRRGPNGEIHYIFLWRTLATCAGARGAKTYTRMHPHCNMRQVQTQKGNVTVGNSKSMYQEFSIVSRQIQYHICIVHTAVAV